MNVVTNDYTGYATMVKNTQTKQLEKSFFFVPWFQHDSQPRYFGYYLYNIFEIEN